MAGRVVFQADVSKFTQPVERSATVVRDLSKALKEQEKAARESFRDQITNAKAAGASVEELQQIEQQRYRSLLALQAAQKQINAETVSNGKAAVNSAEARAEAENLVTAAYEKQLAAVNATFGAIKKQHAEVQGSIAGGAAIRTVDGGQNVRAVENFLSKTLGLEGALQALFPLVGGVAFIQILSEGAEKLYEMHQRAEEAGKALQAAMDDAHAKTSLTIDDLAIQADKLQLNIDKLKGHPGNGLQLGLDEAKKAADDLLSSLSADRKELEALFKESHVGSVDAWLSGSNPTGNQEKSIKARQDAYIKGIQSIETDVNGRYANSSTDDERKALDAERRRRIEQAMRQELANVAGERKDLVSGNTTIDVDAKSGQVSTKQTHQNDVRIGELDTYAQQVQSQLSLYQYRAKIADLMGQEQTLKGGKGSTGLANRAAEDQRRQWETQLKKQQSNADMTIAQEREFWLARLQVAQVGSTNYLFAYDRFLDATKKQSEQQRKQIDDLRKANAEASKQQTEALYKALNPGAVAQSNGIVNASNSANRLEDAKTKAGYSSAESDINFQRQTKQITELDAAMQLQALHTKEYQQALAKLQEQLAAVGTGPDAEAQRNGIQTQIVDLNSRRASQANQDRFATWDGSTSGATGAKDALNDFVRSTRDAATQMRDITASILNSVNDQLANAIVGDNTDWGSTFKGIGKQVAKSGLERAEGSVLGAFGLGKPDGSITNPLNVRVVQGLEDGIDSLFGDSDDSDGGGGISSFFKSIFGGGKAVGGSVDAGTTYLVGEKGPELFTPGTSGAITPNNKLGFGGGDNISYSIDARGTDPVQTDMRVRAAIVAAHQSSVKQAVMQVQQKSTRQPRRR